MLLHLNILFSKIFFHQKTKTVNEKLCSACVKFDGLVREAVSPWGFDSIQKWITCVLCYYL